MTPIASVLFENVLFVVYEWQSPSGELRYSLNVRDTSKSVELAEELISPISVDRSVIEAARADCEAEKLKARDAEEVVVSHVLGAVDLPDEFKKKGKEVPASISNLFGKYFANAEGDALASSIATDPNVSVSHSHRI